MKPTKEYNGRSRIRMYLGDCMDLMKTGTWDLAIVDPPYGIGGGSNVVNKSNREWDNDIPDKNYFRILVDTSINQIIWGGNYMSLNIPFPSKHTIIWDKENGSSFMSDAEIAFTSFNKNTTKMFRMFWMSNMMDKSEKPLIHPTQKPIKLCKWLLKNYAKEGDTILDTHGGSMSIAIACWDLGFDLDIIELDPDYFNDAVKRFENHISQTQLF